MNQRAFRGRDRRGNIIVLTAIFMIAFLALVAMSVDIGYLQNAKVELQRTADAAAVAAAWELIDEDAVTGAPNLTNDISAARTVAVSYAAQNKVCNTGPVVDTNTSNASNGDVVVGYLANPSNPASLLDSSQLTNANAVRVKVRKNDTQNGKVAMFFGRALGLNSVATESQATAALLNNLQGFKTPTDGTTLGILPFALDKTTWDALKAGTGTDTWRWDAAAKKVISGSDGIKEVNLFPQGTGSPGNRGTVDIGGSNNSTSDIARQIVYGINAADIAALGKPLILTGGTMTLNGDTGISAGVKDELASIIGQTRIIPIFQSVSGNGNNAQYTICEWVGVRILDVKLTGSMSSKKLTVQPANVVTKGGVPATSGTKTTYVYSPVWLVR